MPELPEVETIARGLRPQVIGRTILRADLRWKRTLATPSPTAFQRLIAGQQILEVGRRAKFLTFPALDIMAVGAPANDGGSGAETGQQT